MRCHLSACGSCFTCRGRSRVICLLRLLELRAPTPLYYTWTKISSSGSTSTVWETELRCAFGHVPVVWRPTFRPHARLIWPWIERRLLQGQHSRDGHWQFFVSRTANRVCARRLFHLFRGPVRCASVCPIPGNSYDLDCCWGQSVFSPSTVFPDAVPCAMSRALTVVHADLRTLPKAKLHGTETLSVMHAGVQLFPVTRFEVRRFAHVTVRPSRAQRGARLVLGTLRHGSQYVRITRHERFAKWSTCAWPC
jgi:hypothetical protein